MKLSKNSIFIWAVLSFFFTLFLYNIDHDIGWVFRAFCVIGVLFLLYFILARRYAVLFIWILLGAFLGGLIGYLHGKTVEQKQAFLTSFDASQKHVVVYQIERIHSIEKYRKKYIAEVQSIDDITPNADIGALLTFPYNFDLTSGDTIEVSHRIEVFENFDRFAYKQFMISKNIYFQAYASDFKRIGSEPPAWFLQQLDHLRSHFLEVIYILYPRNEAIFLGGILIGARESLPDELKTNFNNSGLTHFIAVSGFNMTILILFLTYILRYFPPVIRLISVTFCIIAFTLLVGDTAPVVRAAIMGLIGYYILMSGRNAESLALILFSGAAMVVWSPYSLNYDVSLHLSFLAVAGIVYTQNFFGKLFSFLPNILHIREAFVLTLAALTFTLPIMIFDFGQVSLLSPLANIAVTWTIPFAMLFGFISVLGYMLWAPIGIGVGYIAWVFLKWDMMMVEFFGTQEYALLQFDFGLLSNYLKLLYFVIFVFLVLYFRAPQATPSPAAMKK